MPPKRGSQAKNIADNQSDEAESAMCDLTVASLEATLQKFFDEADKQSKDRFERLENRLDTLKLTLDKHAKELGSQRESISSLQTKVSQVEKGAAEQAELLLKLQQKVISLEDRSRRNNLRLINLKEGVEGGNALAYLQRIFPTWFPELVSSPPELMRAHRLGPPRSPPATPRTMILCFLRFTDRDRILASARKAPVVVHGYTIRFVADYSDDTARRRRPCYALLNRARGLGYQAFLQYPALIKLTRGSEQVQFDDLGEAVNYIDSVDPKSQETDRLASA